MIEPEVIAQVRGPRRRKTRFALVLLLFALGNGLLINWALPHLPSPPRVTTLDYTGAFFRHGGLSDSWRPMRTALHYTDQGHEKPLYTALYFENNVRFQYPPSCLLVFELLRLSGRPRAIGDTFLNGISWLSIWLLAAVVARIFQLSRRRYMPSAPRDRAAEAYCAAVVFLITLTFYPVVRAYYLGQIQVWIDLLIAGVIWAWLVERRRLAGLLLSLICVIKPTLAIVVVWGVVRREWKFIAGFAVPMTGFALLSLFTFGWDNHVDYLGVLSYISRHGEIFHPNQSMNGLLHRLLGNGNSLEWERDVLMTYNPLVHLGTVASSIAIVALGLIPARDRSRPAGPIDLGLVILCSTLAAPTVWTHHYGVTLPIFAVVLPATLALGGAARARPGAARNGIRSDQQQLPDRESALGYTAQLPAVLRVLRRAHAAGAALDTAGPGRSQPPSPARASNAKAAASSRRGSGTSVTPSR
jgi:alpha-1,2-mannosyltransferase